MLGLDDNLDALRLTERYLAGSRYRPVGFKIPTRLVETAIALRPNLIILDVMLPGVGWLGAAGQAARAPGPG